MCIFLNCISKFQQFVFFYIVYVHDNVFSLYDSNNFCWYSHTTFIFFQIEEILFRCGNTSFIDISIVKNDMYNYRHCDRTIKKSSRTDKALEKNIKWKMVFDFDFCEYGVSAY